MQFKLFFVRNHKRKIVTVFSILLCLNLISPSLAKAKKDVIKYEAEHYNELANLYLPSLVKEEMRESEEIEKINELNKELKEGHGKDFKLAGIGNVEALRLLYKMFASQKDPKTNVMTKVLNENTLGDINAFCGDKSSLQDHLFSKLNYAQTKIGKIQLQKMLYQPTTNISDLKQRQEIIRKLILDTKLFNDLDGYLKKIKKVESEFSWFFKSLEKEIYNYFEKLYFNKSFLQGANKSSLGMEYCHDVLNLGLILPLLFGVIAAGGIVAYEAEFINGVSLVGLYGYLAVNLFALLIGSVISKAFGAPNILDQIEDKIITAKNIQQKMIDVAMLENAVQDIAQKMQNYTPIMKKLSHLNQNDRKAKKFLNLLNKNTFKGQPSVFSFQGRILASYKQMYEIKDLLIDQLKAVGELDAYLSIAKLYKKHVTNENARYCFVEYLESDKPYFEINNFWHPELDPKKVVTNNVALGLGNRNIILTGPNAGGKSTILKAITINLILAQSFGIAPSSQMKLTPFALINTYLNVTDTIGKESLFQAEMNRAKKLINMIANLKPSEFSFIIMDEVFTGTNPKEGAAGAYGILKRLSRFTNLLSVNATHFVEQLSRLEQDTDGIFKNYKVFVNKDENGKILYPYKWEDGVTDQAIALDLLQESGFEDEILSEAYNILNAA
ncbi:MAG: hypothetical protein ABIA74_01485 [bacterium]